MQNEWCELFIGRNESIVLPTCPEMFQKGFKLNKAANVKMFG